MFFMFNEGIFFVQIIPIGIFLNIIMIPTEHNEHDLNINSKLHVQTSYLKTWYNNLRVKIIATHPTQPFRGRLRMRPRRESAAESSTARGIIDRSGLISD